MKKDKPLSLEEKVDVIMAVLSRIEARQLSFRRVINARRARIAIPQQEKNERTTIE